MQIAILKFLILSFAQMCQDYPGAIGGKDLPENGKELLDFIFIELP